MDKKTIKENKTSHKFKLQDLRLQKKILRKDKARYKSRIKHRA